MADHKYTYELVRGESFEENNFSPHHEFFKRLINDISPTTETHLMVESDGYLTSKQVVSYRFFSDGKVLLTTLEVPKFSPRQIHIRDSLLDKFRQDEVSGILDTYTDLLKRVD